MAAWDLPLIGIERSGGDRALICGQNPFCAETALIRPVRYHEARHCFLRSREPARHST
jgi:hypothetical protein